MKKKREMSEDELLALLRASLVREGRLLPETEDEIERVERELAKETTPLPESLRNPNAVLKGTWSGEVEFRPRGDLVGADPEATRELLARAARAGGAIPSEVEEEMRRQRDADTRPEDDETEDE